MKVKTNFKIILPVCALGVADALRRSRVQHSARAGTRHGYPFNWIWLQLGCLLFMGGFLGWVFLKKFNAHPPYPQRDPRLLEAMGVSSNR